MRNDGKTVIMAGNIKSLENVDTVKGYYKAEMKRIKNENKELRAKLREIEKEKDLVINELKNEVLKTKLKLEDKNLEVNDLLMERMELKTQLLDRDSENDLLKIRLLRKSLDVNELNEKVIKRV